MAQSKPEKIPRDEVAKRLTEATEKDPEEIENATDEFEIEPPEEAEWTYSE